MSLTFKEPILQLRLMKQDLSTTNIGFIFSLDTVTFTVTSVLLNAVPEHKKKFQVLVWNGALLFCFSMLMCGPAPFLPDTLTIMCAGILLGGVAGALVNNNSIPAINHILKSSGVSNSENESEIKN